MARKGSIVAIVVASTVLLLAVLAFLFYGTVAERLVRSKALPKLEARLGRSVTVSSIDVTRGTIRMHGVEIRGEKDGTRPLARIGEIIVQFDFWASLTGRIDIESVRVVAPNLVVIRKGEADNVSDILSKLRAKREEAGNTGGAGSGRVHLAMESVSVEQGRVEVTDSQLGVTVVGYAVAALIDAERIAHGSVGQAVVLSRHGTHLQLESAEIEFDLEKPAQTLKAQVFGGQTKLWDGMELSGITGAIARGQGDGQLQLKLRGGYGGLDEQLWQVDGTFSPRELTGRVEFRAEEFTFDRLQPVLANSPYILDYETTRMNAAGVLELSMARADFEGTLSLEGLNVSHPKLAAQPVTGLSVTAELGAHFDRKARSIRVEHASLKSKGVVTEIDAHLELAGGENTDGTFRESPRLNARVVVPPVPCQAALDAIPSGLMPETEGFQLSGEIDADIAVTLDWADLEATTVDGGVSIFNCRVESSPSNLSARRLKDSFRHKVLIGEDKYRTMTVGRENPDFVPIGELSPYVPLAFITREDATFYKHRGFITREFRKALIRNLEEGRFAYGASSITMQTVKNVFLTREKTVSRKIQELFLTWYLETQIEKDRIMEIYTNAIEFGPGLYGIGAAARVYFDKPASELSPMEAVFMATLLPSPRTYYNQFCKGRLLRSINRKIEKTLDLMRDRELITEDEFYLARTLPLEFALHKELLCRKDGYRIPRDR